MEYLDIRTIDGKPTGEVKERRLVHADGDIHGTSHVWIARRREDGSIDLLLQKRSATKDCFPGYFDISSAGHLTAGQTYLEGALRELSEELGIVAGEDDLHFLGIFEGYFEEEFYGKMFKNHEVAYVYLYDKEVDIEKLTLQEEEVEMVKWMSLAECEERKRNKEALYQCLIPKEMEMIKRYFGQQYSGK